MVVNGGKPMRSEDLAHSANTNAVVIRSILSRLGHAKLTTSQLGPGGGAVLARAANEIRLLDVYLAVEDPELFSLHRSPPSVDCRIGSNILGAMQPVLNRARQALEIELEKVSVADIAQEVARLGQFAIPLR